MSDLQHDPFADLGPHRPIRLSTDGARTLGEVLLRRAEISGDRLASAQKIDGRWQGMTWTEYRDRCLQAAGGLARLGLEMGERMAILGPTWTDWAVYDLGGLLAGLTSVGVYPKQSAEQYRYLLEHSESRAVFVADAEEMETILAACDGLDSVRHIVPWSEELFEETKERDERIVSPTLFSGDAIDEDELTRRLDTLTPESTAILVYTSGTTGPPKGAMITHANILALLRSHPTSSVSAATTCCSPSCPWPTPPSGCCPSTCGSRAASPPPTRRASAPCSASSARSRPTVFGSVPRLFEKAYAKIQAEIARKPARCAGSSTGPSPSAASASRHLIAGEPVPAWPRAALQAGPPPGLPKVHAVFGGRVRACITGAAPISCDILEFFWAAGLPVYEAYGMTEATVVTHITPRGAVKPRHRRPGDLRHDCTIADDGEILLGGPFVFKGYYKNEDATREALAGGWLHTGDIGELDDDGFLRITDRKKHLIITAGGKNVAPGQHRARDQEPRAR